MMLTDIRIKLSFQKKVYIKLCLFRKNFNAKPNNDYKISIKKEVQQSIE